MDLYRLQGGADLRVLDISNVMKTNVCLIEWPDRLGAAKPVNRLGENWPTLDSAEFSNTGLPLPSPARLPRIQYVHVLDWQEFVYGASTVAG